MRLYFLPTPSERRLLLDIDVFLIWVAAFSYCATRPTQHGDPPLPVDQACLGGRDLLSQLFSGMFKACFDPAAQKEPKWACASICVLLPRLERPQPEDVRVRWSATQTNHLRSSCRARLSIKDPSVGAEPRECHLLPLLRVVWTDRAWTCWYSPMQINAVGCTHISALIRSSRLSLSSGTLHASPGVDLVGAMLFHWACFSLPWLFMHGRNWAKSLKWLCTDGQFQGTAETQRIKPSNQPQPPT